MIACAAFVRSASPAARVRTPAKTVMPRSAHPMAQAAPIPVEAPVIKTNREATEATIDLSLHTGADCNRKLTFATRETSFTKAPDFIYNGRTLEPLGVSL